MSRVLIAIQSCISHSLNGYNQTMRDTWLKDTKEFKDLEYRFFVGDGTPSGEDESFLLDSWDKTLSDHIKKEFIDPSISLYVRKDDEVLLRIPDRYIYSGYKLRGLCRWGLEKGFDFIFACVTDTYVAIDRLMSSGFENYDYCGFQSCPQAEALCGGPGTWFSKRATQILVESPVTHWAADQWAGRLMSKNGVVLHPDSRYTHRRMYGEIVPSPSKDNNLISTHIANAPDVYNPEQMVEMHRIYKG